MKKFDDVGLGELRRWDDSRANVSAVKELSAKTISTSDVNIHFPSTHIEAIFIDCSISHCIDVSCGAALGIFVSIDPSWSTRSAWQITKQTFLSAMWCSVTTGLSGDRPPVLPNGEVEPMHALSSAQPQQITPLNGTIAVTYPVLPAYISIKRLRGSMLAADPVL